MIDNIIERLRKANARVTQKPHQVAQSRLSAHLRDTLREVRTELVRLNGLTVTNQPNYCRGLTVHEPWAIAGGGKILWATTFWPQDTCKSIAKIDQVLADSQPRQCIIQSSQSDTRV